MSYYPYPPIAIDSEVRQLWGDGPWQQEVDMLSWQDTRTGLHCAMIRHDGFGSWSGYVAVPPDHPLHGLPLDHRLTPTGELNQMGELGRDFSAIDFFEFIWDGDNKTVPLSLLLPAHGGINYAELDDRHWWWFGFDCAHAGDVLPLDPSFIQKHSQQYRDQDYVYGIVTRLAWAIDAAKVLIPSP